MHYTHGKNIKNSCKIHIISKKTRKTEEENKIGNFRKKRPDFFLLFNDLFHGFSCLPLSSLLNYV